MTVQVAPMSSIAEDAVKPALTATLSAATFYFCGMSTAGERHTVKPGVLCGVPCYDYRSSHDAIPTDRAVSSIGALLPAYDQSLNPPAPVPLGRYFQLDRQALVVDHCEVRQAAMTVEPDGHWSLSLRAIHHRRDAVGEPVLAFRRDGVALQTFHLKRNLFVVKVRGLGAARASADRLDELPGRPTLFDVCETFWVENGEPVSKRFEGFDPRVARYFMMVDRIEVEFTYRR